MMERFARTKIALARLPPLCAVHAVIVFVGYRGRGRSVRLAKLGGAHGGSHLEVKERTARSVSASKGDKQVSDTERKRETGAVECVATLKRQIDDCR